MCAAIARRGQPPHVTWVLAKRMPDKALGLEAVQATIAAGRRPAPAVRHRPCHTTFAWPARPAHVRHPDGVEIEEVLALAHEEVDELMSAAQAILDTGGHRVGLGPDNLVAQDPAVSDKSQRDALGGEQQALVLGALL